MTGTQQTFHNIKYYGILTTKTALFIIIQIQSFEKVHLSVVGGCYHGRCYSILLSALTFYLTIYKVMLAWLFG